MKRWNRALAIIWVLAAVGVTAMQAPPQTKPEPSAESLLATAVKQAKAEGKNVFVEFGASWCGPCLQLEKFLEAPAVKPIVSNAFVVVRLTVLERGSKEKLNNPGAEDLLRKWNNNETGIPFYLVLDQTGQPIPNASGIGFGRPGVSTGSAIVSLFERTGARITPADTRTR